MNQNMHAHHDLDLIADYAGPDFDGDRSQVETILESCGECQTELALHHQVKATLAAAPAIAMTPEESRRLRQTVQGQVDQPRPAIPIRRGNQKRWIAIGSVAAATLVVVGVGAAVTQGGESGGDFENVAAEFGADSQPSDATAADRAALEAAAAPAAPEATTAPAAADGFATSLSESSGASSFVSDIGEIDKAGLEGALSEVVDRLQLADEPESLDAVWFNDRELPTPVCVASPSDAVYAVINATVDGQDVEAFVVGDGSAGDYRTEVFIVEGCLPL